MGTKLTGDSLAQNLVIIFVLKNFLIFFIQKWLKVFSIRIIFIATQTSILFNQIPAYLFIFYIDK